jgi:hypothetical protein
MFLWDTLQLYSFHITLDSLLASTWSESSRPLPSRPGPTTTVAGTTDGPGSTIIYDCDTVFSHSGAELGVAIRQGPSSKLFSQHKSAQTSGSLSHAGSAPQEPACKCTRPDCLRKWLTDTLVPIHQQHHFDGEFRLGVIFFLTMCTTLPLLVIVSEKACWTL